MRANFFGCLSVACATFGGCASSPPPPPAAADVPMYSNQEWSEMHSDQSVPELPDQQVATTDPDAPAPNQNTQSSGRVILVPIANAPGNTVGSASSSSAPATAQPAPARPNVPTTKPKSSSH